MTNSILDSVKKNLGLLADYDVFDLDVMTHINTTFMTLHQLGIGPTDGFMIDDSDVTWDAFLSPGVLLSSVKTYVYLKVKMVFDQPTTSFNINATQEVIKELEWRMNTYREEQLHGAIVNLNEAPAEAPILADVDGGGAGAL